MSAILSGATIYLPLAGLINIEEEIARLEKELAKFTQEVQRVQGKLANERFVANAPEEVVAQERSKEADYLENKSSPRTDRAIAHDSIGSVDCLQTSISCRCLFCVINRNRQTNFSFKGKKLGKLCDFDKIRAR